MMSNTSQSSVRFIGSLSFCKGVIAPLVCVSAVLCGGSIAVAQTLYSLSGKAVEVKDLNPQQQQQLFEVQNDAYERTKQTIDNFLVDAHIQELMKKQNRSKEDVSQKLFEVKDPSDKDIKAWYEENKSKIPPSYQFDQIKGEIARLVKQERSRAKRDELLEKLKKDGKFSLALAKPVAPVLNPKIEGFPSKGKSDAKVTIVEFADYQCPHCKHAAETLKQVASKYKDKVRMVFIDFPINPSGISKAVAEASHCADEQGKFWEFHYKAFEMQDKLQANSSDEIAKAIKLDDAKFKACMATNKGKEVVEKARAEGERVGVSGTPFILINGRRYMGGPTVEAIGKEIDAAMKL